MMFSLMSMSPVKLHLSIRYCLYCTCEDLEAWRFGALWGLGDAPDQAIKLKELLDGSAILIDTSLV